VPSVDVNLLDQSLAHAQVGGRLPTVVGGIVQDGSLVWSGIAGDRSGVEDHRDHQFRIGSITKTFTAVLVLQARDAGLVSLDQPVSTYVGEAPFGDRTLRGLLSHTAGVPKEPAGPWWERAEGGDFAALVAANAAAPPMADEGVEFRYSNLAYGLLGEVAARVWGAPWWSLVQSRILSPLGMARTTYHPQTPYAQGWSVSHLLGTLTPEPHADTGAMAPAGQLWSTLDDLVTYAHLVLHGHPDVLALATLQEASVEQLADSEYGLGFRVGDAVGGLPALVGHTGTMPGFAASFFCDRARGQAFIGFANATTTAMSRPAAFATLGVLNDPELARSAHGMLRDVPGMLDLTVPWVPTNEVPDEVREIVGNWYWGERAFELRWESEELRMVEVREREPYEEYHREGAAWVGTDRTHLDVVRREDGSVSHLLTETYLFTRTPHEPQTR
jgi:CubicO group peptidase (beta-lactamase class C family)